MKRLISLIVVLATCMVAFAQTTFSIDDVEVAIGKTKNVSIKMVNAAKIASLQMDVFLPAGVSIEGKPRLTSRCNSTHTISSKVQQSGAMRIIVVSLDDDAIEPGSDALVSFVLSAASSATPGNNTVSLKNIVVTPYADGAAKETIEKIDWKCNVIKEFSVNVTPSASTQGSVNITGINDDGTVKAGATVTFEAVAKPGYKFVEWSDGTKTNPYPKTVNGEINLSAMFAPQKYNVIFNVDGVANRSSLDYGSVIPKPNDPSKTGYTFTGWSPAFVEGTTVPVGGKEYTAQWQVNKYMVNFIVDGKDNKKECEYGSVITPNVNPVKNGYVFLGWTPAFVEGTKVPVGGATYTAQFGLKGDVNKDGVLDVADVTALVRYLLNNADDTYIKLVGNVDGDEKVDVADATAIVRCILNDGVWTTASKQRRAATAGETELTSFSIDEVNIQPGQTKTVAVKMNAPADIASFQMDVFVPEGVTFSTSGTDKPQLTDWCRDTHTLSTKLQDNGSMRFIALSLDDEAIRKGTDNLLTFTITASNDAQYGDNTVSIANVVVAPYAPDAKKQTIDKIDWKCNIVNEQASVSSLQKDVKSVEYIGVNGVRTPTPVKGVRIVRKVMNDGSIMTKKEIQK